MNILIDAHVFDEKHQGTRTYLKGLYSELIPLAKDWSFFMVAYDIINLKKEFGSHPNLTYIKLKRQNKFYRLLVELPAIIRKSKIDFAHFQYIGIPFKGNCKLVVTTHDVLFEQQEFKSYFPLKYRVVNGYLFKRSAQNADVLLSVSNYSRNKISELYKIPNESIHITPNAVGSQFNQSADLELSKEIKELGKYILYVARIEPRKNHLAVLKAFKELKLSKRDYKLVFIGRKDILSLELERYIERNMELDDKSVVWLDNVRNESLFNYYKNCELFVFPSFAEGFGIPPLEAMAAGSKLLCSKETAMADFNLPQELTFDPSNIEELKQKILVELKREEPLTEIYRPILEKYNWSSIATDFYNFMADKHGNTSK